MFQENSKVPNDRARILLRAVAKVINQLPNRVTISGHTSASAYGKKQDGDWSLSAARADSSRQILSDASQLASLIDHRLRYGLAYKEELQLLNGDGTGQNLLGIIPQATAYAAPFDPAGTETGIDMIRLALLQAELAEYPSSGIIMNPMDWARMELLKDTTGRYIIGNPQGVIGAALWNRPVVTTQAIAVDKFLAGAFQMGAQGVAVDREREGVFVQSVI